MKVLVVDDEKDLSAVIVSYFEREGYAVSQAFDGPSAVSQAKFMLPDLIILDLMLPGFDGIEVCRQIRTFSDAYILMLTAREEEIDKIVGFAVGADDYVVKPVSPRELIARANAILRRPRHPKVMSEIVETNAKLRFDSIEVDSLSRTTSVLGKLIELTKTEFDLLEILMEDPKRVFSRQSLLEAVWGGEWFGELQVVDVHIGNLRKKLSQAGASQSLIRTVRGVGYGMALR
jgi:DNA-binding response OmpR family regulator